MRFNSLLPLVACSLGTFLLLVHTTIVTVSLPAIENDLDAGFAGGQWIINGYTVALGACLLAAGAAGDVAGHRTVFRRGLALFTLATVMCGLAPTAPLLIAARITQGIGGAAMLASMIPLLVHTYVRRQRTTALALWSVASALGGTVGTVCGGLVAHPDTWRLPFLASVPLALGDLVTTQFMTTQKRASPRDRRPVDLGGTVLTVAFTGSLVLAVTSAGQSGFASPLFIVSTTCALASIIALVTVERRIRLPALPPSMFASRRFTGTLVVGFAYYLAAFGPLPALAIWLSGEGFSATAASLILAIQQVGFVGAAMLIRVPEKRHGRAVVIGLAIIAGGTLLGALVAVASLPAAWMIAPMIVSGTGAGIVTPILPHRATDAVTASLAGAASGSFNAARQIGLAVGVAACSGLAHAVTGSR